MKLFHTSTSPFVRKVMIAAHELDLVGRIETTFLRPMPMKIEPELSKVNPLSKIPALILDDGSALYDSTVIIEYFESLGTPRLIPPSGAERFRALRTQALADGVMDAGIAVFYELNARPKELHWEPWISGQTQKALQGFDALEREVESYGETFDVGQIAAACAVGWHAFRKHLGDPFEGRPRLAKWFAKVSERPSMQATVPVG